MKTISYLISVIILCACAPVIATSASDSFVSVAQMKSDSTSFTGGPIRVRAYLVSTDHGAFLTDRLEDQNVLGVSFSEEGEYSGTAKAVRDKLRLAGLGKPFAELLGVFEGRLTVASDGGRLRFEIYSGVYEAGKR